MQQGNFVWFVGLYCLSILSTSFYSTGESIAIFLAVLQGFHFVKLQNSRIIILKYIDSHENGGRQMQAHAYSKVKPAADQLKLIIV